MHRESANTLGLTLDIGNRRLDEIQPKGTQRIQPISLIWKFIVQCRNSIIMLNNLNKATMMIQSIIFYLSHSFTCQHVPKIHLAHRLPIKLGQWKAHQEMRSWVKCGVKIFIPVAPHLQSHCWLTVSSSCQVALSTQCPPSGLNDHFLPLPLWV